MNSTPSIAASKTALGQILDPTTLRFERYLPVPIAAAWDYLTRPDLLKLWLADGIFEPSIGGKVDLQFDNDPLRSEEVCRTRGTVLEWKPPTRLSYTWMENEMEQNHGHPGEATIVVFELAPATGNPDGSDSSVGSLLTLTHQRLNPPEIHLYMAGWHTHLAVLSARAAHTDPPVFNDLFRHILPEYAALAGIESGA